MFCRRRHSLLHLILLLLGVRSLKCCQSDPEERSAFRAKRRLFRSKLREAFEVWEDEPAAPGPEGQEA